MAQHQYLTSLLFGKACFVSLIKLLSFINCFCFTIQKLMKCIILFYFHKHYIINLKFDENYLQKFHIKISFKNFHFKNWSQRSTLNKLKLGILVDPLFFIWVWSNFFNIKFFGIYEINCILIKFTNVIIDYGEIFQTQIQDIDAMNSQNNLSLIEVNLGEKFISHFEILFLM